NPDAPGTNNVARLPERGPQALSRHLEQTEARQPADLDAGAVHLHGVAQAVFDVALVLGRFHVDEIDHNQAADIADTQLPRDLFGGLEIGIGRGRFDVAAARGTGRVDV